MSEPSLIQALMRAIETHTRVADEMLSRRNVVACGVGYKIAGGETTSIPSVVVSVTHKVPPDMLSPADLVPRMLGEVPTDVVATGEIRPHAIDRRARMRPVRPGLSIGHVNGTAGTVGALVRRDGELFVLSNNHVLALLNKARTGDAILQPGPGDGGSLLDQIGQLAEFVPLRFLDERETVGLPPPSRSSKSWGRAFWDGLLSGIKSLIRPQTALPVPLSPPKNYVDAALVRPLDTVALDPCIIDVGGPPAGIAVPGLGTRVIKSGRTTGLTQGTVLQIDVTVDVRYDERVARFAGQIMTSPLSRPGDSGSLVLDYERNAVGLLFSGSDAVSVVNPIQSVLKAFKAELVVEVFP